MSGKLYTWYRHGLGEYNNIFFDTRMINTRVLYTTFKNSRSRRRDSSGTTAKACAVFIVFETLHPAAS